MCGRYLLRDAPPEATHSPWAEYWRDVQLKAPARYNIAPGQNAPVLVGPEISVQSLTWGYKPAWSKYPPQINARAETAATSPLFRQAFGRARCLVMADGFYEPKGARGVKHRPWYVFERTPVQGFCMAGIVVEGGFAILTCAPNASVAPIHDRMPVILPSEHWAAWLALETPKAQLTQLCAAPSPLALHCAPVADTVKNPRAEGPECLAPP